MQLADPFELQQQSFELVFPGADPLDGSETLLEDRLLEEPLASMLGLFPPTPILSDVRDHPRVEDRLTVTRSVVATVQAQDRAGKIDADALGDVLDVSESLDEERGFVAVARSGDEGSNHVAMAIAKNASRGTPCRGTAPIGGNRPSCARMTSLAVLDTATLASSIDPIRIRTTAFAMLVAVAMLHVVDIALWNS